MVAAEKGTMFQRCWDTWVVSWLARGRNQASQQVVARSIVKGQVGKAAEREFIISLWGGAAVASFGCVVPAEADQTASGAHDELASEADRGENVPGLVFTSSRRQSFRRDW